MTCPPVAERFKRGACCLRFALLTKRFFCVVPVRHHTREMRGGLSLRPLLCDVNAVYPSVRPSDDSFFSCAGWSSHEKCGGMSFFCGLKVKKMNPTRLKELLKEREQSLQGSKKDLISRLLDWEKTNQA